MSEQKNVVNTYAADFFEVEINEHDLFGLNDEEEIFEIGKEPVGQTKKTTNKVWEFKECTTLRHKIYNLIIIMNIYEST